MKTLLKKVLIGLVNNARDPLSWMQTQLKVSTLSKLTLHTRGSKIYNDNIEIVAHIGQTTDGFITFNFYLFYT